MSLGKVKFICQKNRYWRVLSMAKAPSLLENQVAAYRESLGLTQEHLARVVEVSRQTIVSIEGGQYNPSTVLALRLALLFGVTVNDLFMLPGSAVADLRERSCTLTRPDLGQAKSGNPSM
jgi:putative transcriptional regulator